MILKSLDTEQTFPFGKFMYSKPENAREYTR